MFRRSVQVSQADVIDRPRDGRDRTAAAPVALHPDPLPDEGQAHSLADYTFTDLYVRGDPLTPVMARGLRPANLGIGGHGKGLARIPDVLVEDVMNLYRLVMARWQHSGHSREFTVSYLGQAYRCSLIAAPALEWDVQDAAAAHVTGLEWVLRQISSRIPTFDDLNMPDWARTDIMALTEQRGLVLVAGPFASGKTTLASTAFNHWVEKSRDVGIALEDPPEIPMERTSEDKGKIIQIDLLDRSIREAIKNSRRWSPRYVFLGEVRGSEVSGELLHMAISGPLTICTIHASDPVQAIVSLFRFAAEAMSEDMAKSMIASCLRQVFHQEIVNGRAILKGGKFTGSDSHLIKAKISSGNFRGLYEDFDRQVINRVK